MNEQEIISETLKIINKYNLKEIVVSGYVASILKYAFEFIATFENNELENFHLFGYLKDCKLYVSHTDNDSLKIKTLNSNVEYLILSNKLSFIQSRTIETFGPILKPLADDFTAIFYHTVLVWCKIIPPDDNKVNRYWEVWLVYLNNKPIGICGLYTLHTAENLDELWLGWLGIIPEFRNLKLGTQIMEHLYVEAKKVGCKRIYSYVDKGGAPLNFYNREGFKVIGTVQEYLNSNNILAIDGDDFESPDDFVIMKEL